MTKQEQIKKIGKNLKPFWLFMLVFTILLTIDLVTKHIFTDFANRTFIPNFISIHYVQNRGVAFGWLYGSSALIISLTSVMIVAGAIFYTIYRHKKLEISNQSGQFDKQETSASHSCNKSKRHMKRLFDVAFALFLSGALGNLIDRIFLGYVRDFIRFDFMNFPVFNLADVFINLGVLLLVIYFIIEWAHELKKGRTKYADKKKVCDSVVKEGTND
ncbi:MAG: signal peptidase II [Firmicutes bacterium]|nr:signal peptidase II [Bacillota bacterium]